MTPSIGQRKKPAHMGNRAGCRAWMQGPGFEAIGSNYARTGEYSQALMNNGPLSHTDITLVL